MNQRPNVVIITTDQQRTDSISCYGSQFTHTPNLDRLAQSGVLFSRAYCTNPVCTPSRASLFTGRQVSRHGAWNVGTAVDADEVIISDRLAAAGYRTHNVGKAHFQAFGLGATDAPPELSYELQQDWEARQGNWNGPYYGFQTVELALGHTTFGISGHYGAWVRSQVSPQEFESFQQSNSLSAVEFGCEARDWDLPLRLHNSVWTADRAINFLEQHDSAQPFLLSIGFQDPHHPHALPRDFNSRVDPQRVPLPEYSEGELEDKPPHFKEARHGQLEASAMRGDYWMAGQGRGFDYSAVSDEDARLGRAYYYNMVRLIDEQMGRILDALDRLGWSDNTIIVFTSDHGELLGDHGLWEKGPFHYEQIIRVPLIVRWPNGFDGGRSTPALFSLLDIVPTILAAAGLPSSNDIDGINALPVLRAETTSVRDSILVECIDDPHKLRLKTIVTEDRKLTWYAGQSYGELYDLQADPGEKVNRWHDRTYAADKSALLSDLLNQMERLEKRNERYCYA